MGKILKKVLSMLMVIVLMFSSIPLNGFVGIDFGGFFSAFAVEETTSESGEGGDVLSEEETLYDIKIDVVFDKNPLYFGNDSIVIGFVNEDGEFSKNIAKKYSEYNGQNVSKASYSFLADNVSYPTAAYVDFFSSDAVFDENIQIENSDMSIGFPNATIIVNAKIADSSSDYKRVYLKNFVESEKTNLSDLISLEGFGDINKSRFNADLNGTSIDSPVVLEKSREYRWKVTISVHNSDGWSNTETPIDIAYLTDENELIEVTAFTVLENQFEADDAEFCFEGVTQGYPQIVRLNRLQKSSVLTTAEYVCSLSIYDENLSAWKEIANSGVVSLSWFNNHFKDLIVSDKEGVIEYGSFDSGVLWDLDDDGRLFVYGEGTLESLAVGSDAPWYHHRENVNEVRIDKNITGIKAEIFKSFKNLENFYVDENNPNYAVVDGTLYNKEKTEIICVPKTVSGTFEIPEGVETIGDSAFYGCKGLTNISLPVGVSEIESNAFYNCTGLNDVTIPETVINIGTSAFQGCKNLSSIIFSVGLNEIGEKAFYNCNLLEHVVIPSTVTFIGASAFNGCSKLTSLEFEENSSLKNIGDLAFAYCNSLVNIAIPDSVENIGVSALKGCNTLEKLSLPFIGSSRKVNSTYDAVFGYIFGYSSTEETGTVAQTFSSSTEETATYYYYIPTSIKEVAVTDADHLSYGAFHNCVNINSIYLNEEITTVSLNAFDNCSGLEKVNISNISAWCGIQFADAKSNPLYYAKNLYLNQELATNIIVSSDITVIKSYVFYNCINIETVVFEAGGKLASIGSNAFYGCTLLKSIDIPDSVTSIGSSAFADCVSLSDVNFTENSQLTTINDYAFKNCGAITAFDLPAHTTTLGRNVFEGTLIKNIFIPKSVTSMAKKLLGTIIMYSCFSGAAQLEEVEFEEGMVSIPDGALKGCSNVKKVTLPESVSYIGISAFSGCSLLSNINIPESLISIGSSAFWDCSSIVEFGIPKTVTSIGQGAFGKCSSLKKITLPFVGNTRNEQDTYADLFGYIFGRTSDDTVAGTVKQTVSSEDTNYYYYIPSSLKEVIITDATYIAEYAFENCANITSITFDNNNIIKFGSYAFKNCTGLNRVDICDLNKWLAIDFGNSSANPLTFAHNLYVNNELISDLEIGSELSNIGKYCLSGCTSLISVIFIEGNTIAKIGEGAFANCTTLRTIDLEYATHLFEIGSYAFSGCLLLAELDLPSTITTLGRNVIENTGISYMFVPKSVTNMAVPTLFYDAYYSCFAGANALTSVEFEEGMSIIPEAALRECTSLTNVIIPESVTAISARSFARCFALESIELPKNITSIGYSAFYNCTALKEISLPDGLLIIEGTAFGECNSLTEIVVPNSVTNIGFAAFECEKLEKLTVPFIGSSREEKNTYEDLFGYFFDRTTSTTIEGTVKQTHSSDDTTYYYYIPSTLKEVVITDARSIAKGAFRNCSNITNISLNSEITNFGSQAFDNCTGLKRVDISNLNSWLNASFVDGASNPLTYAHNLYVNNELLKALIVDPEITSIGVYALSGCTPLESVTFVEGSKLTNIGYGAFKDCTNIDIVNAPSLDFWLSLSFGTEDYVFDTVLGNFNLSDLFSSSIEIVSGDYSNPTQYSHSLYINGKLIDSVFIPKELKKVSPYAFINCESINSVIFEEGSQATSIGKYAFSGCSMITELVLPEKIENIGSRFVEGTQITEIAVPKTAVNFGANNISIIGILIYNEETCFYGAEHLSKVVFEQGIETIPFAALRGCNSVIDVVLPNSINDIKSEAFKGCSNLADVMLPSKVKSINSNTFDGCSSLKEIIIPSDVETIGYCAFRNCTNLNSVIFTNSNAIKSIGNSSFKNCSALLSFDIPDSVTEIGGSAFSGCGLTEISVPKNVTKLCDSSNNSFVLGVNNLKKVVFEDGINKIPDYALAKNTSVETIDIPNTVSEIGTCAFSECTALKSLTLPEYIETLGASALPTHSGFVVYCYPNSAAETYAINNNIKHEIPPTSSAITVKVYGLDGEELKSGYTVNWYKNGSKVASGKNFKSYNEDDTYSYEIVLGSDLSEKYYEPLRQSFTASNALEITCSLEKISTVDVTGKIVSSGEENFEAATIVFTQRISGSKTKTVEITIDATGTYAVTLINVPTDMRISATGFKNKIIKNISDNFIADSAVVLNDIAINKISGNKISLSANMIKASVGGQSSEVEVIKDVNNIQFTLFNATQNKEITSFNVQYPYILLEDASILPGDEIKITATDNLGKMNADTASCVLDEDNNGSAAIEFVQNGTFVIDGISADFESIVLVFDADGNYVSTFDMSDGAISEPLTDGTYKLVFMSDNDLIRRTSNYETLTKSGLVDGVDFTSRDIEITSGVSAVISDVIVPTFDESKFKYTDSDYTELTVNKTTISAGKLITLKAQYKIEDKYITSAQKVIFELPENASFIENSVTLDGVACDYEHDGNSVIVYTNNSAATIRCCVAPLVGGEFIFDSYLSFENDMSDNVTQSLGNVTIKATDMTFDVPETTAKKKLSLTGTAIPNATIKIYDNDHLIGECESNKAGAWSANVELYEATDYTYHNIYATAESSYGYIARTLSYEVFYNESLFEAAKVTMINTAWRGVENVTVIDFLNPSTKKLSYDYYSRYPTFTFKVEMTTDNGDKIGELYVITTDKNGRETKVKCTYDSKTGLWVGKHNYSNAHVKPMGISVEYELAPNTSKTLTDKYISTNEDLSKILPLTRYYLSDSDNFDEVGMFGYGWKSNYDVKAVYALDQKPKKVVVTSADVNHLFEEKSNGKYISKISEDITGEFENGKFIIDSNGTTTVYDAEGRIESKTSEDGTVAKFSYFDNHLVSVKCDDELLEFVYENGKVIKAKCNDEEVIYNYDGDYLTSVTDANGSTEYSYNIGVRNGSEKALSTVVYDETLITNIEYDCYGRLVAVYVDGTENGVSYEYIDDYNVKKTDADGVITLLSYNKQGVLISISDAAGNTISDEYDDEGNLINKTIGDRVVYSYEYDKAGNISEVTNSDNTKVSFGYDENNNLSSITDTSGNSTQYAYTADGQLEQTIYSDGLSEGYNYNGDGKLIQSTDRSGNVVDYKYDSIGRVSEVEYADGTLVKYTYDSNNNLLKISENNQITTMNYDGNNLTKVTYPNGRSIQYVYDEYNRIVSLTDSEGYVSKYEYNDVGMIRYIKDKNDNVIVEYVYSNAGTLLKQLNSNGTYTEYEYIDGILSGIYNFDSQGEIVSKFEYTYDTFGNIIKMIDNEGTWLYEYDEISQLKKAVSPDGIVTEYIYDERGNRVEVIENGNSTKYQSNDMNQYTFVDDSSYSYDDNGNLVAVDGTENISYEYDIRGRLIKMVSGADVYEYEYDSFGNRSAVIKNGVRIEYVNTPFNDGLTLVSYDAEGNAHSFVQGYGLSAQVINGETYFYNYNILGSTSEITDAQGDVANAYTYSHEGQIKESNETLNNPFKYVGKYGILSDDNNHYFIRERYLSSKTMSFVSLDPSRLTYDLNMYRYANNNPVTFVDLNGEFVISGILICVGLGAVGGVAVQGIKDTVTLCRTGKWEGTWGKYGGAFAGGAVSGLVTGLTGGWGAIASGFTAGAAGGAVDSLVKNAIDHGKVDWKDTAQSTLFGGITGGLSGGLREVFYNNPYAMYDSFMNNTFKYGSLYKGSALMKLMLMDAITKANVSIIGGATWSLLKSLYVKVFGIDDPSGYVYEAVPSNRVEGVTATAYTIEEYYDEFDELQQDIVLWDATEFDQENPLITDVEGRYAWDVPAGKWQVKYEKENYVTTYSEWLDVPPPQTEVNVEIISTLAPEIKEVYAYDDYVEVTFSQYMTLDTTDRISVFQNNNEIDGSVVAVNAEDNGKGVQYASIFRFVPSDELKSGTVNVKVQDTVNYAGTAMTSNYDEGHNVIIRPKAINIEEATDFVEYGNSDVVRINITPDEAAAGKKVTAYSTSPSILSVTEEVVTDAKGYAEFVISGNLPGEATIVFAVEGTDLNEEITVIVGDVVETVKSVKASLSDHSTVNYGSTVSLSSDTDGATIYYSLNGGAYVEYKNAIELTEDVKISTYASKDGYIDSNIVEFEYYVKSKECLHTNVDITEGVSATCTESGLTEGQICLGCGKMLKTPETEQPLGHNMTVSVERVEATCTEDGFETVKCSRCDNEESTTIEALDHDYSNEWTVDKRPSCTVEGLKSRHCSRCDSIKDSTIIAANGHNMGEYYVTITPSCTSVGEEQADCSDCDYFETRVTEKLSHTEEILPAVKATCLKTGLTEGKKCFVCGEILVKQAETTKLAHSYKSVVTSPTCTSGGYTTYTCSVCKDTYKANETVKLGHSMGNFLVVEQPSCTENGIEIAECLRCDYSEVKELSATGHNNQNGVCTECGESKSDNCSCNCHKTGFMSFIWKILRFFYKLFGTNKVCSCGVEHY